MKKMFHHHNSLKATEEDGVEVEVEEAEEVEEDFHSSHHISETQTIMEHHIMEDLIMEDLIMEDLIMEDLIMEDLIMDKDLST
jgi:hypothetical protein